MVDKNHGLPEELLNLPDSDFEMVQAGEIKDEKFKTKPVGFFKDALFRLRKSKISVVSFWIIMAIVILSLLVPSITGYTYTEQSVRQKNLPPKIPFLEDLGIADGTRVLTNRKKAAWRIPTASPKDACWKSSGSMRPTACRWWT